jgi:hypothetical protein
MTLSFKEKKDFAIDLIKQGYSQREIPKRTLLSFSIIAKIRKDLKSDTSKDNKKTKLTQSKAIKLF